MISTLDDKTHNAARQLLIKSRIYRFLAAVFAAVGFVVFLALYVKNVQGNFWAALSRPSTIIIVIVPFLPAAVFSWISARLEAKFFDLIGDKLSSSSKNSS